MTRFSQKRLPLLCLLLICLMVGGEEGLQAGRLEEIEETVRESQPERGYIPLPEPEYYPYDYFWPPYSTFSSRVYFYPYPYFKEYFPEASAEWEPGYGKSYSLTSGFCYLYDLQGDLDGFRGYTRLRTPFGALEGDFTRFREEVEEGNDYLNLYYLDYLFGFLIKGAVFEIGFGYTGLRGNYHQDGPGLALSLEINPARPLVLQLGLKYSYVHHSEVGDYRVGLGRAYRSLELRGGYRYLQFEGTDIHGPEIGIWLWF